MAEIPFEALLLALEATKGTKVEPTHYANMTGTLRWRDERYVPQERRGTLVRAYRSKIVRKWGEWSGEGPLDVYMLPVLLNAVATGNMSSQPTTPGGATNSRLWTFVPNITRDDLKTLTLYWGDRNVQMWRGVYGTIDEMTISNNASGTDGATISVSGRTKTPTIDSFTISDITEDDPAVVTATGHTFTDGDYVYITDAGGMVEVNNRYFIVDNAAENTFELTDEDASEHTAYTSGGTVRKVAPAFPAQLTAPLIVGSDMQVWIDTGGDAIGTTEIVGRVVSAEHVIPVNLGYKHLAQGPTGDKSYTRTGRSERQITTRLVLELPDLEQYDLCTTTAPAKVRVRHNGDLIEGAFYHYVQVDTYGPIRFTDWGELEGTNRTIQLEIMSEYNSGLGADWSIAVQNNRNAL